MEFLFIFQEMSLKRIMCTITILIINLEKDMQTPKQMEKTSEYYMQK